jgi:nucleoside-diphosphate-sugar epimerase
LVVTSVSADSAHFTILGASGFIGTALSAWLASHDSPVHAVTRASLPALLAARRPAGHMIDCIGATFSGTTRPIDAAEAHIGVVAKCLSELRFDSFLLLSSTRVYAHANATDEETALPALPADPSDLFAVTKLAGEALCLADPRPLVRVVRLSSVYGTGMPPNTFLGQLLREGIATGRVVCRQSAESTNDYINIATVVRMLSMIATGGRHRLYNVASGANTGHDALVQTLRAIAGWQIGFAADVPAMRYPLVATARLTAEFGPTASDVLADLPALLAFAPERYWPTSIWQGRGGKAP